MYFEIAALLAGLYVLYFIIRSYRETRGMPPGPFPLPIIGNIHHIDYTKPHVTFRELSRKYGKIFTLQLGVQRSVVICGAEIAREALLKKAAVFAGRPPTYAGDVFSGGSKNIAFQNYSPSWKIQHRVTLNAIRMCESKVNSLEELISREVEEVAAHFESYEQKPQNPQKAIFTAIVNCMGALCFGKRFGEADPDIQTSFEYIKCFKDNLGAANILDAFPVLTYFPFRTVAELRAAAMKRDELFWRKFGEHKKTFDPGNIRDLMDALLAARLVEGKGKSISKISELMSDERIIYSCNDAFIAGGETPSTALLWLFVYLAKFPDVQARLHKELDDVIGQERPPRMQDKLRLPYTEAVIAELMRYVSFMPVAIPHYTVQDVTLGGYRIPKDTVVYPNLWAIQHDPDYYDKPFEFDPERFLDADGKFIPKLNASYMPFSLGKRSCLGESIARTELFLFTAQLAHKFKFEPCPEEPLPDPSNSSFGIVLSPREFKMVISRRSKRL